ncbi:MarR family transcriptional regulator, partial [Candidatus Bathyarchaeota archaeon]|nr:MarR family transcriptional regulator [Candidatus Bathyarchaeota archaeon]
ENSIQEMRTDLTKLATQPRLAPVVTRVDAPIPVQGEDVFQQLTETEMEVLEMIVDLGEGTVPEIREKIDRTREHTARLLKKLYDRGFIDRNTSGMPYRYSIRKEIRDLILELKEQGPIGL